MLDNRHDLRSELDPKDYRFINETPDPDFSPERNRAIVAQTIKESEEFNDIYKKAMDDETHKRMEMFAYYARHTIGEGKSTSFKNYIGKEAYNALIGEKVLEKIRVAESLNRMNGNNRFKKGILL